VTARRDLVLPREQLLLKRATKGLVRAVGGSDAAAESLAEAGGVRVRQQRISDCTLPNTADFLRIDEAAELEDLSHGQPGWPHLTRALARRQGFALLPLPSAPDGLTDWHRQLAEVSREAGEAVGKVCDALAGDSRVDRGEVAEGRLVEEVDEAIAALAGLRALLQAVEE